ncbi:hypothetical protein QL093DRAFT_2548541 [Fusarium oxysporum]|nr:hypothetical protein QL093DRAFT_2548541 [Fusarium oxysporum]
MDPLSTTASIIATIQLSSEVVKYVNAAAGATNLRKRLREEVRTCEYILQQLKDGADDSEEGKAWSCTIEALQGPKGPLGRLDVTLQTIQAKLLSKGGHKKVLETLKWPFTEREVEKILAAIEREKSLLWLALENDHRKLTLEIKKTSTEFKRQLTGLEFKFWRRAKSSVLWLTGILGSGKTVLVSTVIDFIQQCGNQNDTDLRTLSEILMLLTSKSSCILELFRQLGTQGHHLNILLSSRDEADIREVLSDFPRIRLESVSNCFRMLKLKPSFRETILQSLRVQASGMFFWVRCQLDEIAQLKTMKDIREALKTLPERSARTYENILVKIPSGTIRIVRQLLQWLVCTVSPLSLGELHESLAIEPNMDHICEEAALLISPEDIQDLCGNLIVVTAKGNVMLAHLSVKDYLLSDASKRSRASIFAFSESEANIQNALSCLTYLSFADFRSGPAGSADDFESRLLRYPFLYHASIWWAAYVRNANLFSEELSNKALRFFSPSCRTIFMSLAIKERKLCWNAYPRQATSLYYAASGAEIDAEGGRLGATAFHAAALRGHVNVRDMLFAEGADPNRTDVIKRLLKQGADPCAKDEYGSTPYDLAYSMGHTDALNHLHMNKSKEMEDIGPSSIRVMHTIRGEGRTCTTNVLVLLLKRQN